MNAYCLTSDGKFKLCPYRVFTEEHKAMLRGNGDFVTQNFYECAGEACTAYHDGICLRVAESLMNVEKQEE